MLAALTEFIDKDEIYALSTMVEAQIEQSQVRNCFYLILIFEDKK